MTKARDLANSAAAFSAVSATELGYVDGVTSAIQTQLDAKADSSTAVTLTGTQTLTNKTLTSPVIASVVNNTLTSTTGDIIYASAANTPARLGIGSSAQILTVASGLPAWSTPAAAASGLTLVASSDFTTSSSIVINNCFSATYKNYLILCDFTATSNNGDFNLLFRVSGTNSTTGYNYNVMRATGTTVSATQSLNAGSFAIGEFSSSYGPQSAYEVILYEPFTANQTKSVTRSRYSTSAGAHYVDMRALDHDPTTSYDGFNLTPAAGNVTGNIRVYGYALT